MHLKIKQERLIIKKIKKEKAVKKPKEKQVIAIDGNGEIFLNEH